MSRDVNCLRYGEIMGIFIYLFNYLFDCFCYHLTYPSIFVLRVRGKLTVVVSSPSTECCEFSSIRPGRKLACAELPTTVLLPGSCLITQLPWANLLKQGGPLIGEGCVPQKLSYFSTI